MPASTCRAVFSSTTMASSTTTPVATVRAISERLSRLKPASSITARVPRSATDPGTAGIRVARHVDCVVLWQLGLQVRQHLFDLLDGGDDVGGRLAGDLYDYGGLAV